MKKLSIFILVCMLALPTVVFAQEARINVMSYTNPQYTELLKSSQTNLIRPQVNIDIALVQNKEESVEWKRIKAQELQKAGKYVTGFGASFFVLGLMEIILISTVFNSANHPDAMSFYLRNPGTLGGTILASGIALTAIGGAGIIAGGTMWGIANNRLREIYTGGSGPASETPTSYLIQ